LNVIAEQYYLPTMTFDLSCILNTAVQNPVVIGVYCQIANFVLYLWQQHTSLAVAMAMAHTSPRSYGHVYQLFGSYILE